MQNHPSTTDASVSNGGPLAGVRIVDFCSFIAGSYATMLLGDLGAKIVKVEPLTGDLARAWGPFLAGESRWFQGWNRNKRSIALDLRSETGQGVIYELIRRTDVVIENYRPGVAEKLKIDYASLRDLNPRLIYCSSTAFGSKGPLRDRPAYDPVLQSMGGAAQANIRYGGRVAICSVAASDYQAAMLAASGVLAALYHREKTGEGQKLETSLLQGIMSVQSHYYCQALECEEEGALGIYPYRLFETKDNLIFIGAATDKFWRILCEAIGAPELAADSKYQTNAQRVACAEELTATLATFFRQKTTNDWESILVTRGVPCGSVKTFQEFFAEPQVEAMDMNPMIHHPSIGPMRVAGVPIHFEKTPGQIQHAAPMLGQHTREILGEIGYGSEKIDELRKAGVVFFPDSGLLG